jgi:two-component system cell cycle sensor histidine kinase/response regulator CckA
MERRLFRREALGRYGLAAVSVAAALGVRWLLDPILEIYAPYLPFTLAVMVAGRFGGRGPAFAATAGGLLCSWYFLLEPRYTFVLANQAQALSMGLFVIVGAGIAILTGQLRQALEASRRGESQLRRFTGFAPAAIAMFDREMRYLAVSDRFKEDYGLEGALMGCSHYEVFPEMPERWREVHRRVLAGAVEGAKEDSFERKSGQVAWLRWEMRPWYQPDGSIGGAVLATEDITFQKEAEAALRRSEQRFRTLFENAADGIFITSPDQKFLGVNRRGLELSGYSREELLGLSISDFLAPQDQGRLPALIAQLRSGQPEVAESWLVRKDGSKFRGEVSARLLPDGNLLGIVRDLTERRHLEEQIRQAQKLEGIGRLAGGVAHDFNNLLTVISGYARMGLDDLPVEHDLRESLTEIDQAAERAAALTRQLLAFSRNQLFEAKTLVIDDVVRDFEKMLRRIIGEDIDLTLILDAKGAAIRTEAGRIEQVVLNLAVNSRDAMPEGGKLVIETACFNADAEFAEAHPGVQPGPHVTLAVGDTGTGMTAEVKAHVFEPFFTTKEAGKGTGLGLSTVYGIVKQSGGSIWIDSEPGRGSTFYLIFPAAEAAVEAKTELLRPDLSGTETILLVEDELGVRKYLRQALERHGYTVIETANGREALEEAQSSRRAVHLLLTDMVMPEMGGAELAALFGHGPRAIPVLCMSGYTDRAWRPDCPTASFIQKPFTSEALLGRIRQLLAGQAPAADGAFGAAAVRSPEKIQAADERR